MPLPASWKQVPITGHYLGLDGSPIIGRLLFRSFHIVVIDGIEVVPRQLAFTLDAEGRLPEDAQLPSTNDPDLNPGGWGYTVIEDWLGGRKPYQIIVPHDAVSLNMPDVAPAVPPGDLQDTRGPAGADGLSAYEIAMENGFEGGVEAWLYSLRGEQGDPGEPGSPGDPGPAGEDGAAGASAYQVWLDAGNTGTVLDFLASLKGPKGDDGEPGTGGGFAPVEVITGTSRSLLASDAGKYLRFTATGEKYLMIAEGPIGEGREFHIANRAASGNLRLMPQSVNITLHAPAYGSLTLEPGQTVTIKAAAPNEGDVMGATAAP